MATQKTSSCHSCHDHSVYAYAESPAFHTLLSVLEKISLVVLVAFAFYTNYRLASLFTGMGTLVGLYFYWGSKPDPDAKQGVACAAGLMEQVTKVPLPPPLGLAANVAMTIAHLEHHSTFVIPIVGFNFGMLIGKLLAEYLPKAYQAIKEACSCYPNNAQPLPANTLLSSV